MKESTEKYVFIIVGFVCFVFLSFILPNLIPDRPSQDGDEVKKEAAFSDQDINVEVNSEPTMMVVGIQGIMVKASGDEPLDEDFPSLPLDLRKEFQNRYDVDVIDEDTVTANFSVPPGLGDIVNFWVQVFGRYGKGAYLFHHKDTVELFYSALDLKELDPDISGLTSNEAERLKNKALIEEKRKIQATLKNLEAKIKNGDLLNGEEERLRRLFSKNPSISLVEAADLSNIRIQGGFAHRFKQAIITSGLYMKEMERIFKEKQLPVELTRIPLVESAFNIKAVSSAQAVGLWQFIPETGARYLKIDEIADERLDPIFSTYAAATHLKSEFALLGEWPLTINAYNTGPGRMMRAIKQLNTKDIEKIIREFKEPAYQFYSKNYYPEFLAALHVYNNQLTYFGRLNLLSPLAYEVYSPNREVDLSELAEMVDLDAKTLKDYNPAFSVDILSGDKKLPANYLVKVPSNMAMAMAQAETLLDEQKKTGSSWYVAENGDTLESIAGKFGLPLVLIEKLNDYRPQEALGEGTFIELPAKEDVAAMPAAVSVP